MPEKDGKDQRDWSCKKKKECTVQSRKKGAPGIQYDDGKQTDLYIWRRKFLLKYVIEGKIEREEEE